MGRKIFLAAVAAAFLYLTSSLLLPVVMGGILAVLFVPLMRRMRHQRIPPSLSAMLVTLGVTVLVLLPASFLIFAGAKSGMQQLQALKDSPKAGDGGLVEAFMAHPAVAHASAMATKWLPVNAEDLMTTLHDLVESVGKKSAELLGLLLSQLPRMVLDLALVVVSLFFFLVDGTGLVDFFRSYSVYNKADTDRLFKTISLACRSVIVAAVLSAAAQAVIELLAVWIAGVPNPALIALIVFVTSFIPVVGSAPMTFGVGLQQLFVGRTTQGVALLIVAVIVGGVDNVVRAAFLKGSADLHPLIAFIAALGGLAALGFPGVFIGPIVAVVFLAVLEIDSGKKTLERH